MRTVDVWCTQGHFRWAYRTYKYNIEDE